MVAATPACPACGSSYGVDPGFLVEVGLAGGGVLRWMGGVPERGPLGGLKEVGREHWDVRGWRCRSCGLLSLYGVTRE